MRILITNDSLTTRGGTETFVRQLARGLQALGHSVIAYSSNLREGERLLENDVIPVATDLENLPFRPDVVHGQHHLDVMTALNALPDVPALYHCHGAVWRGWCPTHPRIYRYLAVSRTLRERIMVESNIDPSRIDVLLNGVDLSRFSRVRHPKAKPRKGLLYNSRHQHDSGTVGSIREAAKRAGLELDLMGFHFGTTTDEPEKLLPEYDVVFASGLSAIEAMASGCAVVVLGRTSCGEMVLPENFERFREVNFSIATNSEPPSVERIASEIQRYSAEGCAAVSARLRREADFKLTVDRLVATYEALIERHKATEADLRAEILANSLYLRKVVPLVKATDDQLGRRWSSASQSSSLEGFNVRLIRIEQGLKELKKT